MRFHQSLFFEFLESHVSEIIDSLFPSKSAHVVVSYFNEVLSKDFESICGSLSIWRVELAVDFFRNDFAEYLLSIDERTILDIEVKVAKCHC